MARRVRRFIKEYPQDVLDAVNESNAKYKTSSAKLRFLKRNKIKPITALSEVKNIANSMERKLAPIHVSTKQFDEIKGYGDADGLAIEYGNGKCEVVIHPIVQYTPKKFIKDVIMHEYDHVKVFRKRKGKQKPIANGIRVVR